MKVKDVQVNQVFNIEHTPSYPKLKTSSGYWDIRDNIHNNSGNCDERDCEIMSLDGFPDDLQAILKRQIAKTRR